LMKIEKVEAMYGKVRPVRAEQLTWNL